MNWKQYVVPWIPAFLVIQLLEAQLIKLSRTVTVSGISPIHPFPLSPMPPFIHSSLHPDPIPPFLKLSTRSFKLPLYSL